MFSLIHDILYFVKYGDNMEKEVKKEKKTKAVKTKEEKNL